MAEEQQEKSCRKHFEKIDEIMSPISGLDPESKRSQEERKKIEYLELLQNEDNKKLIEQYLNKMGVKDNPNKNYTFSSTKERVYQKILDQQSKSIEDHDRGSPKRGVGSPNKNYTKYYSTTKEKNGLHGKISLKNMNEDGNDTDRRTDLKSLVQKKKGDHKKPSYPTFNTNLTPRSHKSFNQDGTKYRKVNLNGEIEVDAEKKMKQTIVQLRRTIESQKNELLKLDKSKKESIRYIAKLESVLNEELGSKKTGNKNSLNISNGSINKFASRKGLEAVVVDTTDYSKLKELYNDSKAFVKCIGNMLIEIESTIETMQTAQVTPNKSMGLTKKNTLSDLSSFEGAGKPNGKNDRIEKILSAIRTNYIEFSTKLENKYLAINTLPETDLQNTTDVTASVAGRNSVTQRLKSKISSEFKSNNRVTLSEKKRFTTKADLEKRLSIKRNIRNSVAVSNLSF